MAFGGSKFAGGKFAQAGSTTAAPTSCAGYISDFSPYGGQIIDKNPAKAS